MERRFLAGKTRLRETWRAASRRGKAFVASTRAATACRDHPSSRRRQIRNELLVLVEHLRPNGDAKLDRFTRRPVLQRAAARFTAARLVASLHTKGGQIAQIGVRYQYDVPSGPTVATIGPALGDVLLTTEVQASVAAAACLNINLSSIVEHTSTLAATDTQHASLPGDRAEDYATARSRRLRRSGARHSGETRPCPGVWRRWCRRARCPCLSPGGTSSPAAERGSSRL